MAASETDLYTQPVEYAGTLEEAEATEHRRHSLRSRFVAGFIAFGLLGGAAACDSGHHGPPSRLEVGASSADIDAFNKANFAANPSWQQDFAKLPSGPLSSRYWNYDIGVGSPAGWGNQEREYYTNDPANVGIANGVLNITAMQKAPGYTSARIKTEGKYPIKYGKIDVDAKLPAGAGTWPGIWMLPENRIYKNRTPAGDPKQYLNDGEIDIMEEVGIHLGQVFSTAHSRAYNATDNTQRSHTAEVSDATTAFHDYELEWTPDQLIFMLDGKPTYVVDRKSGDTWKEWPYNQQFYLILNVALGGTLGGENIDNGALPADMKVKYIKYWRYIGKLSPAPAP